MEALFRQKLKLYISVFGISTAVLAFYYLYKKYLARSIKCSDLLYVDLYPLKIEDAELRSSLISSDNLQYTLFLYLKDKNRYLMNLEFEGSVLIEFTLKKVESLFVDFRGEIKRLVINDQEIASPSYSEDKIYLSKSQLKEHNKVLVEFKCLYSNNKHGLRHVLAQDSNTYITSNFEPFYAHTAFPCFDQLDLKAKVKLLVATQESDVVISSGNIIIFIFQDYVKILSIAILQSS